MRKTVARFTAKTLPLAPLALAALPSAQAGAPTPATGIVYTDPADDTGAQMFIDMGDPLVAPGTGAASQSSVTGPEFSFYAIGGSKSFIGIASGNAMAGSANYAASYTNGDTIGSGSTFQTSFSNINQLHNITSTADNYLAVSFQDGNSATHYGWIRVSYSASGFSVYDFAYNATAGASILAGQTSAIPEPAATAALAALLAGSAALYAKRRRSQAAA